MKTLSVKVFRIDEKIARVTSLFLCIILLVLNHKYVFCVSRAFNSDSDWYYDYFKPPSENQSVQNNRKHHNHQPNAEAFNSTLSDDSNKEYEEENASFTASEHEVPKDVPVKIKIHGNLATPSPHSGIHLDFVPKQTYYQVRRYDTELHLPKSAAHAEAETLEELINAPRLREIVSHKKTQEVYEEQGYEDAAYDHGGYKKAGEHHENKSPVEQEPDYSRATNLRAEQVEMTNIKKEDDIATESSHMKETPRTVRIREDVIKERSRNRNRKAKLRGSESNPKAISKEKKTQMSSENSAKKNNDINGKESHSKGKDRHHSTHFSRKAINKSSNSVSRRPINVEDEDYLATAPSEIRVNEQPNEMKLGEKLRLHSTNLQMTKGFKTDETIKPTTYHPLVAAKFLTNVYRKKETVPVGQLKSTKIRAHRLNSTKSSLIDNSGYKFENPFINSQNFVDGAQEQRPWRDDQYEQQKPSTNAYNVEGRKVNREPYIFRHHNIESIKYESDAKRNANEMVLNQMFVPRQLLSKSKSDNGNDKRNIMMESDAFKTSATVVIDRPAIELTNEKQKTYKRNKTNDFPYQIIDNKETNQVSEPQMPILTSNRFRATSTNQTKESSKSPSTNSIFGEPDNSPWIPITSKEVYGYHHNYNRQKPTPTVIQVASPENSYESTAYNSQKTKHTSPIRVVDRLVRPLSLPTSTTNYSIQHVYPIASVKTKSKTNKKTKIKHSWPFYPPFSTFPDHQTPHNFETPSFHLKFPAISSLDATFNTSAGPEFFSFVRTDEGKNDGIEKSRMKTITNSEFQGTKDIDTLSSNRYNVFQSFNSPTSGFEDNMVVYPKFDSKPPSPNSEKLLFRHPHFSRETSYLIQDKLKTTQKGVANSTLKTSLRTDKENNTDHFTLILPTQNNTERISHFVTNTTKRGDHAKHPKIVVYPVDYDASPASFVENLTLAHYSDPRNAVLHKSSISDHRYRFHNWTDCLKNYTESRRKRNAYNDEDDDGDHFQRPREELLKVYLDGSTTEIMVDVDKYPFYKNTPSDGLSKYSVIRYISNPNRAPRKKAGQMSFYESTNHIRCTGPSAPRNIVPKRANGEWTYDTRSSNQRIRNLGDSILCLKIKFFGSDPLDNPFFKEEFVGFPQTFPVDKKNSRQVVTQTESNVVKNSQRRKKAVNRRTKKNVAEKSNVFDTNLYEESGSSARDGMNFFAKHDKNLDNSNERFLRKRSAKINDSNDGKKVVHKVYLAGGFINIGNNVVVNGTPSRNQLSDPSDKILADQDGIPFSNWTRLDDSLATKHFSGIPRGVRIAYGLRTINRFVKFTNATTANTPAFSIENQQPVIKIDKKDFVVDEGLRSSQNFTPKSESTDAFVDTTITTISNFTTNFNDSIWKSKKNQPTDRSKNKLSTPPHSEIDSLLYVIHPKTGKGKWMKILKVEQIQQNNMSMIDSYNTKSRERTSLDIDNIRSSTLISPNENRQYVSQDDHTTVNRNVGHKSCQEETNYEEKLGNNNIPEKDVYRIIGLLKKVAPLKASEMEINSLQTSEEQVQEISNNDGTKDEMNPSFYDHKNYQTTSRTLLEPHERLYYYVLDDENDEQE